jgi:outer membrane protein with beta-barrel domain
MRGVFKHLMIVMALAAVLAPAYARAEGYVNPWAGVQFGSDIQNGRGGFGVNAGGMGNGIVGGEVGLGFSPSFFGTKNDFGNNTVLDLMGNVIVGVPIGGTRGGGARPYFTGGVGLIRTQIDGGNVFQVASSNNQFGYNVGGGAMGFFNDHVGVRGDVRYLRTVTGDVVNGLDLGDFHFWRASFGVVIR